MARNHRRSTVEGAGATVLDLLSCTMAAVIVLNVIIAARNKVRPAESAKNTTISLEAVLLLDGIDKAQFTSVETTGGSMHDVGLPRLDFELELAGRPRFRSAEGNLQVPFALHSNVIRSRPMWSNDGEGHAEVLLSVVLLGVPEGDYRLRCIVQHWGLFHLQPPGHRDACRVRWATFVYSGPSCPSGPIPDDVLTPAGESERATKWHAFRVTE